MTASFSFILAILFIGGLYYGFRTGKQDTKPVAKEDMPIFYQWWL